MVPINYLAVLAASVAQMVVGSLWYGPLFGKTWMALSGITPEKKTGAKDVGTSYALATLGALVMNYVLAHSLVFASAYLDAEGVSAGLMSGFWNWLGFVAPVTLGRVLWENQSPKLWLLSNGYYLLSLLIGGVILALWT